MQTDERSVAQFALDCAKSALDGAMDSFAKVPTETFTGAEIVIILDAMKAKVAEVNPDDPKGSDGS